MRLLVHYGMRTALSALLALVIVSSPFVASQSQAAWLVREGAEPAPQVPAAPAPQSAEQKLSTPKAPQLRQDHCEKPCERRQQGSCPLMHKEGNATARDMAAQVQELARRLQSLVQAPPTDPKVVALVGAKLADENPDVRREATAILGQLSSFFPEKAAEVFPYLLEPLKDAESGIRAEAFKALLPTVAHMPEKIILPRMQKILNQGNSEQRAAMAGVIINLKSKFADRPELGDALLAASGDPDQNTQFAAIVALTNCAPQRLPEKAFTVLEKGAQSQSVGNRYQAYSAFAALGPDALKALPTLLQGAKDPHYVPRWAALRALGRLGKDAVLGHPEIIAAFMKALESQDLPIQQVAALYLGKNLSSPALPGVLPGTEKPEVMANLKKLLQSKDRFVAHTAAWALVRIDPKQRGALPEALLQQFAQTSSVLDSMADQ